MPDKKLLLITPDFPPNKGGVASYLAALADHLSGQIEVLVDPHPAWQTTDLQAGYPIYRAPLLSRFLWPRWMKTVRYVNAYRDRYRLILTSHVLPFGTAAWVAKRRTGVPYIVFVHGMDIRLAGQSPRKKRLCHKVLKGARLVVANSQALAREVAQTFGVQEMLVVYPCLKELPTEGGTKQNEVFELLTVSRLVERKGHSHVLNALAHLRGTGELPSFLYHIVGEGPMESTLRSMVATLGLDKHVIFHGAVSDDERQRLYQQSHVFVMPVSHDPIDKEGFGLVFIEAAAAGLPSITTAIEGVDEAVLDGQTGVLLQDQNEQALANAIRGFAQDHSWREALGAAAKEHAKGFTCTEQFSKLDPYL